AAGIALDLLNNFDEARDVDLFLDLLEPLRVVLGVDARLLLRAQLLVADQRSLAAVDRLVADHDAVYVAVLAGELDGGAQLALVALGVLTEPRADRDLQADIGGNRRYQLDAARRRIKSNRLGIRRQPFQIRPNLSVGRLVSVFRMPLKRGVGNA